MHEYFRDKYDEEEEAEDAYFSWWLASTDELGILYDDPADPRGY